jgi:uncharacterized DUF497 family protein
LEQVQFSNFGVKRGGQWKRTLWVKFPLIGYTISYYNKIVEERRIVWDEAKNAENKRKHGISFETARFVFADPERLFRLDRSESNTSGEERWQSLGMAEDVIFAVYMEQEAEGVHETRLITARLANKAERRSYNGYYRIDNKGWSKAG